ncbi:MAG: DUF4407 domain-containing protein [Myxococcota bacterium]
MPIEPDTQPNLSRPDLDYDEENSSLEPLATRDRFGTVRRWIPVLPFFGVMLRGKDAPLFQPNMAPTYHPSVGYARDVYVAITMNWLVDALGFTWMFHGYFVSLEPWWLPWLLAALLGTTFSSAFATFAISMVRKPIQDANLQFIPITVSVVLFALAIAGFGYEWYGPDTGISDGLVNFGAGISLAASIAVFLFATYGFQDGSMIFVRGLVMFTAGFLVAGPLHETMFYSEIIEEHGRMVQDEARDKVETKSEELAAVVEQKFGSCMLQHAMPADPECFEAKQQTERASLMVSAIEFVKNEEEQGADPVADRGYLIAKAKDLEATDVVALIGVGATGKRGKGPRYFKAVGMEKDARSKAAEAQGHEDLCRQAVAECETEVRADPAVANLQAEVDELDEQAKTAVATRPPGVLDRAEALEAITRGDSDAENAEARSMWMTSRLAAAWFLAMVMPLIVLIMKLTAGDKLEPYLRKRWAGR